MKWAVERNVRLISRTYEQLLPWAGHGFRRRVSVVVRTAISVQRENGGRESDLKCSSPRRPSILERGTSRAASSIQELGRVHPSRNRARRSFGKAGTTLCGSVRVQVGERAEAFRHLN